MLITTSAVAINYGDFSDIPPGTVMYLDVTETSVTDPLPLYNTPTITGDLLDFDPTSFGAYAPGPSGADVTDGQLNFTVMAAAGESISELFVSESGDYTFTGATATAGTLVVARAATTVTILEVDNVTLLTPIVINQTATFFDDYASVGNAPAPDAGFWSLVNAFDLDAVLPDGYVLGATKVEVVVDNQLSATVTDGNIAFIAKKDFSISTVPEPTSLALLGLGGLLLARRNRQR